MILSAYVGYTYLMRSPKENPLPDLVVETPIRDFREIVESTVSPWKVEGATRGSSLHHTALFAGPFTYTIREIPGYEGDTSMLHPLSDLLVEKAWTVEVSLHYFTDITSYDSPHTVCYVHTFITLDSVESSLSVTDPRVVSFIDDPDVSFAYFFPFHGKLWFHVLGNDYEILTLRDNLDYHTLPIIISK